LDVTGRQRRAQPDWLAAAAGGEHRCLTRI
jgi:hypothetical protein